MPDVDLLDIHGGTLDPTSDIATPPVPIEVVGLEWETPWQSFVNDDPECTMSQPPEGLARAVRVEVTVDDLAPIERTATVWVPDVEGPHSTTLVDFDLLPHDGLRDALLAAFAADGFDGELLAIETGIVFGLDARYYMNVRFRSPEAQIARAVTGTVSPQ